VRVALLGYGAAILLTIPLAIALASSRLLSRTLLPLIVVVHATPIVAVAPIIVVTLGVSDAPRIAITFLITFFPIIVSTTTGLLAAPPEMIELSRSLRAGRTREMLHIRIPYAIPYRLFHPVRHVLLQDQPGLCCAGRAGDPEPDRIPDREPGPEPVGAVVATEAGAVRRRLVSVSS
jgi:ABC-type proline/glycine betaine transport system permease subunit